jgi:23S rRNA (cytosine1962-C5)-methyltransferase
MERRVVIREKKEKSIKNRHPWIYSGAVKSLPSFEDGEILPVVSSGGEMLGHAYFNKRCSLVGRMVNFDERDPLVSLRENMMKAFRSREEHFDDRMTNCYRLINAEGDRLPGLVADRYSDVVVVQISTLGMERLKPFVVDIIKDYFHPVSIYEKSNMPSRREEGLELYEGLLHGENMPVIDVVENSMKFKIDMEGSQKTGFFLDQRSMRELVMSISKGKTVLNGFGYTGAFSVYALKGFAERVWTIDISERAIKTARENILLNGFDGNENPCLKADMFEFMRRDSSDFDLIILDPPAFAKKRKDVVAACRAYKDINRLAIKKIRPEGYILTCSCSAFVDEALFRKVVFQAAAEAGRDVRIIQKHRLSFDHPISIYHPEGEYLKSFLLSVS